MKRFWLVVYSNKTGDFKNAILESPTTAIDEDMATKVFENDHPRLKVIDIGVGTDRPKSYID